MFQISLKRQQNRQTGDKERGTFINKKGRSHAQITKPYCVAQGFPDSLVVKNSPASAGDLDSIPGLGRSPEEEMATHSSILAWEILWTEEPGGLQPMGLQESDTTQ